MVLTLVVLAAGMGSRYGGLKQLDPVGPSGEVVLDYSVHDAVWAGFDRVVFVIRRDFEKQFRENVVARYEGVVEVDLAFQETSDLPEGLEVPEGRQKPWGTGHAIWAARNAVPGPFLVVNADDFYGMGAFSIMAGFLKGAVGKPELIMGMVAYPLRNTLSEHGTVSRGVCTLTPDRKLKQVEEHTGIVRQNGQIVGANAADEVREFQGTEMVSMNFWGFSPAIFDHLGDLFRKFLDSGGTENPKSEFYIPSAVSDLIAAGLAPASVLLSNDRWFGVTYREDRQSVADAIAEMVGNRLYLTPLWKHTK